MLHNVSANRMTLLKLRKRLVMARRGHALMKHKLDELMRVFQKEIQKVKQLRKGTDEQLKEVYEQFLFGKGMLREEALYNILTSPLINIDVEEDQSHLLNLKVPVIREKIEMSTPPYGLLETNADMDKSLQRFRVAIQMLLRLAENQRRIDLLSHEIENTRRRVNALEYILIPQIESQVRFIQHKLEEVERANVSRLMRIKGIIRGEQERQ